jgi:hypothetical protein
VPRLIIAGAFLYQKEANKAKIDEIKNDEIKNDEMKNDAIKEVTKLKKISEKMKNI